MAHPAHRPHPALLAIAGACLWGTTGTSQALLVGPHSPVAVGGLRAAIATVGLVLAALLTGRSRQLLALPRSGRVGWLLLAGLAVACYQLTFFAAVAATGVAVGTLVMLATAPGVAGLLGLAQGDRPGRTWALATLLCLAGASALVLGSGRGSQLDWRGLLMAVAAGAAFATYSVAARRLVGHQPAGDDAGVEVTAAIFLVASLVLALPLAGQDLAFAAHPRSALVLLWLGLAATAVAYLLYQSSMRQLSAATASTLALAEPVVANLLAVLVLHERFTPLMGLGVLVVLGGLGVLSRQS